MNVEKQGKSPIGNGLLNVRRSEIELERKRRIIATLTPQNRTAALKGTISEMARSIATEQKTLVLVLTGRLDGHNGLPSGLTQHGKDVKLCALGAYTDSIPTAIFAVSNEDSLCDIVDALQASGGYRAYVIDHSGSIVEHYSL